MIHLACLRGNIGYWSYYSTVIKVKDLVNENRIITVSESDELYTENINRILQRELKKTRIKSISNYFNNNNERFFNNLIVAIHKGNPKWTDIDLYEKIKINGSLINEQDINFLESKFGILSLSGNEQIFALDGQHRLKGIRKAYADNPELENLEIPITFVLHNHEQVDKTRRLFTVLNKYAEKPRGAELIIIDEDDAAAINTRKLVNEHPVLSKNNALSTSKTGAISNNDNTSFTTLVTLHKINKILYHQTKSFYTKRPSEQILDDLYSKSSLFWDTFFDVYSEIIEYIEGNINIEIEGKTISRNDVTGGSLLLRPVGQELIANAFIKFIPDELDVFKQKIRNVNFSLNGNIWKYVYWNDKMLGKEIKLKNNLLLYLLGKYDDVSEINIEMTRIYNLHNQVYDNHIIPISL